MFYLVSQPIDRMRKSVATPCRRDELVCLLLGEQNRYMLYYELVAESFRGLVRELLVYGFLATATYT